MTTFEVDVKQFVVSIFSIRYLALEGLCAMSQSDYSRDAVRKHQETIVKALKVSIALHPASSR